MFDAITDPWMFVVAGLLLNLTPGADVAYTVSRAASQGARAGVVAALGIGAGCIFHVALATLGISAAIAAFLGKKPHIRQIRLLGSAAWSQQGRLTIQASHALGARTTRSSQ